MQFFFSFDYDYVVCFYVKTGRHNKEQQPVILVHKDGHLQGRDCPQQRGLWSLNIALKHQRSLETKLWSHPSVYTGLYFQ